MAGGEAASGSCTTPLRVLIRNITRFCGELVVLRLDVARSRTVKTRCDVDVVVKFVSRIINFTSSCQKIAGSTVHCNMWDRVTKVIACTTGKQGVTQTSTAARRKIEVAPRRSARRAKLELRQCLKTAVAVIQVSDVRAEATTVPVQSLCHETVPQQSNTANALCFGYSRKSLGRTTADKSNANRLHSSNTSRWSSGRGTMIAKTPLRGDNLQSAWFTYILRQAIQTRRLYRPVCVDCVGDKTCGQNMRHTSTGIFFQPCAVLNARASLLTRQVLFVLLAHVFKRRSIGHD